MTKFRTHKPIHRKAQQGAITMFSAVLILILLTELILYAVQVGIFEQRKSANDVRQKQAFHVADAAIQYQKQYLRVFSDKVSDSGTNGWLLSGSEKWKKCSDLSSPAKTHPCFGEPVAALRAGTYYYEDNGSNALPLNAANFTSGNENVTTHALLCMLEIDRTKDPVVQGCTTNTGLHDSRYFMITLLARGEADCTGSTNCNAEALIAEKIGSFGPGGGEGGPNVPLTARTNVPLKGTVEVVPNPNGGGVGVPISTWANARTTGSCALTGDTVAVDPGSGSYSTCEAHEWYGVDDFPADYMCPTTTCACKKSEGDRLLSYAEGNDRILGIDVVEDPLFPCDLWAYSFGIPKTDWQKLKDLIPPANVLTSCASLDSDSSGIYWISGATCDLKTQVGKADDPVFLISAVANTKVSAGAQLFGVLWVTDAEVPAAEFTGNGTATIYGAAVMDATMEHFNGTFQIVYIDSVLGLAYDIPLFGDVAGGWTDFHAEWQ